MSPDAGFGGLLRCDSVRALDKRRLFRPRAAPGGRRGERDEHVAGEERRVRAGPRQGERLIRNAGSILIKVDPRSGSKSMALGTRQVPVGTGIRVHQHREADEVLFVLEGRGFGILGDKRIPVEKGSAIYVPTAAWHGVENPDSELLLLWVAAPPGLESSFREVGSKPGAPAKEFTLEQLNDIARKHATLFR